MPQFSTIEYVIQVIVMCLRSSVKYWVSSEILCLLCLLPIWTIYSCKARGILDCSVCGHRHVPGPWFWLFLRLELSPYICIAPSFPSSFLLTCYFFFFFFFSFEIQNVTFLIRLPEPPSYWWSSTPTLPYLHNPAPLLDSWKLAPQADRDLWPFGLLMYGRT